MDYYGISYCMGKGDSVCCLGKSDIVFCMCNFKIRVKCDYSRCNFMDLGIDIFY